MSVETMWWQSMYGKLVQHAGGPIIHRIEHGCTGRSSGMPDAVAAWCYPDKVGIGTDDQSRWEQYPWKDGQGGIIVQPVFGNGTWYLVAGKIRGRSEEGEGRGGRHYTQAHYLVQELAQVADVPLFEIPNALNPEPMQQRNFEMEPVPVKLSDRPLPESWLRDVQEYLVPVLSGHRAAVQDWERSPQSFCETAMLCLACLPTAMRWRLPIGCGMYQITDKVALGHGMTAKGGVRKIQSQWRGLEGIDLSGGREYLAWLQRECATVKTSAALQQRLRELLPGLSGWDQGIPPALDWKKALAVLLEYVRESDALKRLRCYLIGQAEEQPPNLAFHHIRRDAIAVVVEQASLAGGGSARACHLLEQFARSHWKTAWEGLESSNGSMLVRSLGMILGHVPIDPAVLVHAVTVKIPSSLQQSFGNSLTGLLTSTTDPSALRAWAPLMRAIEPADCADWLTSWAKDNWRLLLWKGLEIDLQWPQEDSLRALAKSLPSVRAARDILGGRRPSPNDMEAFLKSILLDYSHAAVALFQHVWYQRRGFAEGLRILRRLSDFQVPSLPAADAAATIAKWDLSSRGRIAVDVANAARHYGWSDELLGYVLKCWSDLPQDVARTYLAEVQELVGSVLGQILTGQPGGQLSQGKKLSVAIEVLWDAMQLSPAVVERAVTHIGQRRCLSQITRLLRYWISDKAPDKLRHFPALFFVRELETGCCQKLPELDCIQAIAVTRLLLDQPVPDPPTPPGKIDSVGQFRAWLAAAEPYSSPPVSELIFVAALKTVLRDPVEREFWGGQLRRRGLAENKRWRLLADSPPPKTLARREGTLISKLDRTDVARLLAAGWPVPSERLPSLAQHLVADDSVYFSFDREELSRMLTMAAKARCNDLTRQLALFLIRFICSQCQLGVSPRALEAELSGSQCATKSPGASPWLQLSKYAYEQAGLRPNISGELISDGNRRVNDSHLERSLDETVTELRAARHLQLPANYPCEVRNWIAGAGSADHAASPLLRFVHELKSDCCSSLPSIEVEEAITLTWLVNGMSPKCAQLPVVASVGQLRAYMAATVSDHPWPPIPARSGAFKDALRAVATNSKERLFWGGQLRRLGKMDLDVWRLLRDGTPPEQLLAEETDLLGELDAEEQLRWMAAGWIVPPRVRKPILADTMARIMLSANEVKRLLRVAEREQSRELALQVLRYCVETLAGAPHLGVKRDEIISLLQPGLFQWRDTSFPNPWLDCTERAHDTARPDKNVAELLNQWWP